jgi:hypothetical protein
VTWGRPALIAGKAEIPRGSRALPRVILPPMRRPSGLDLACLVHGGFSAAIIRDKHLSPAK